MNLLVEERWRWRQGIWYDVFPPGPSKSADNARWQLEDLFWHQLRVEVGTAEQCSYASTFTGWRSCQGSTDQILVETSPRVGDLMQAGNLWAGVEQAG